MTDEELQETLQALTHFVEVQAGLDMEMGKLCVEMAVRITALEKVIEDWEKKI